MQKQIKIFLTLLTVLILAVSCAKNNPNNPIKDNGTVTGITTDIQYGSKSIVVNTSDQAKLKELWIELVGNKTVYSDQQYKWKSGEFKADASYYETTWDSGNTARTEYIKNVAYIYNGKIYLAGIYWDNKPSGMPSSYRLIIIDEKGIEQAWFGGGNDKNTIPNENTQWTKYDFVFGYIQNY